MARGRSNSPNRSSPAKKRPAKGKRPASTAPAKGTRKRSTTRKVASTTTKRMGKKASAKKASKKMGKPRTASTASHKGASTPPKRAPKTSRRRAATAQAKKDEQATTGGDDATPGASGRIVVENVNVPGYQRGVDAAKYREMKDALLQVLPARAPGLTQNEMAKAVAPLVSAPLRPKAMWWAKTVQLDLEAKRQLVREARRPLRWHRA